MIAQEVEYGSRLGGGEVPFAGDGKLDYILQEHDGDIGVRE